MPLSRENQFNTHLVVESFSKPFHSSVRSFSKVFRKINSRLVCNITPEFLIIYLSYSKQALDKTEAMIDHLSSFLSTQTLVTLIAAKVDFFRSL